MRIAMIDGGTYYHHRTLNDPELARWFAGSIYAPALVDADLSGYDCLYVASRQDPADLIAARPVLDRFLAEGGTIAAMSESHSERWLPDIRWRPTVVNFWWWLTPGADSGLRIGDEHHGLFRYLKLSDLTWHRHGVLTPPPGAVSLADAIEGGSILYDDAVSTPGRLIVTTLDPCYHHGSYFMPAASRFLRGFLPWLAAEPACRPAAAARQSASG